MKADLDTEDIIDVVFINQMGHIAVATFYTESWPRADLKRISLRHPYWLVALLPGCLHRRTNHYSSPWGVIVTCICFSTGPPAGPMWSNWKTRWNQQMTDSFHTRKWTYTLWLQAIKTQFTLRRSQQSTYRACISWRDQQVAVYLKWILPQSAPWKACGGSAHRGRTGTSRRLQRQDSLARNNHHTEWNQDEEKASNWCLLCIQSVRRH